MRRIAPYIAFIAVYALLPLLAHATFDRFGLATLAQSLWWLGPVIVSPLALIVAASVGRFTVRGIALCASLLSLLLLLSTALILVYMERAGGGTTPLLELFRNFLAAVFHDPWQMLTTLAIFVLVPSAFAALFVRHDGQSSRAAV